LPSKIMTIGSGVWAAGPMQALSILYVTLAFQRGNIVSMKTSHSRVCQLLFIKIRHSSCNALTAE
jgi:hypothetical protein